MKTNFPYDDQFFKDLEVFLPQKPESNSMHSITRIARYLNFNDKMIDTIREEWKLFIFDSDSHIKLSELPETVRIDEYWRELFVLKNPLKKLKYEKLSTLIKTVFTLPHGNSDPERGFSINKAMVDINHNESTIVSFRLVKDTIRIYGGVLNVSITLPLLQAVKDSHKVYQDYLRCLKEEEEKLVKRKGKKKRKKILKKKKQEKGKMIWIHKSVKII